MLPYLAIGLAVLLLRTQDTRCFCVKSTSRVHTLVLRVPPESHAPFGGM